MQLESKCFFSKDFKTIMKRTLGAREEEEEIEEMEREEIKEEVCRKHGEMKHVKS